MSLLDKSPKSFAPPLMKLLHIQLYFIIIDEPNPPANIPRIDDDPEFAFYQHINHQNQLHFLWLQFQFYQW